MKDIIDKQILSAKRLRTVLKPFISMLPGKSLTCKASAKKYYLNENGEQKYLNKSNTALIRELEKKNYCKLLDKALKENISILSGMRKRAESLKKPEQVFKEIPGSKRHLISANAFLEDYIDDFSKKYGPGRTADYFGNRTRETDSGYYVRSKSEEQIADRMTAMGLKFIYEMPVTLKTPDGRVLTRNPDFTVYNPFTGEKIIYEHFGKLDDPQYAAECANKIALYLYNGYEVGRSLFMSFEGEGFKLTKKEIRKTLEEIALQLGL